MTLKLAKDFTLPIEAVTETFGIVAKRGSGKTYCAKVMVEEMLGAKAHVCVLDPIGVWWGLRTAADGKSAGLPILVLGGDHGDLPIEPTAGAVLADLVMDGHSVIIDLSRMRKGDQRRFCTDFLERLYHGNKRALHLVLEEADMVAPQRPPKGFERLLGAAEDIVRRGRSKGIGVTMITQRPAVIHKDVLTQVETLIALRLTGPQDRKAIDAWVEHHGDQDLRKELMHALPSLPIGTAIVWSPGWLKVFQRVAIRKLKTFDSSRTPKPGSPEASTGTVAQVNIKALEQQMAATVEKAAASDPTKLQARVRQLEAELRKAEKAAPRTETVEVSVLTDKDRQKIDRLVAVLELIPGTLNEAIQVGRALQAKGVARPSPRQPTPARPAPASNPRPPAQVNNHDQEGLDGPESRILNALAWLVDTTGNQAQPETAVAFMANYKVGGGAFNNPKARLRRKGLIDYGPGKTMILTPEGDAIAAHAPTAATPEDIHQRVFEVIDGPMRRILEPLIAVYPDALTNDELAEASGYSPNGGAFNNPRGRLRSCGLVDYVPEGVRASPVLFLE